MYDKEYLMSSPEYWIEKIQNELYRKVDDFLSQPGMTQDKLARRLKVSKGYISQILNGNFDHKLSKLVQLSLAIDKVPDFNFINCAEFCKQKSTKPSTSVVVLIPKNTWQTEIIQASSDAITVGKEYAYNCIEKTFKK
jgi:transcriptional regulator with XRE-family HTH domain